MMSSLVFTARVIPGAGRGKKLGSPTLNLHLEDVPAEFQEGVYACTASLNQKLYPAVLHFGPRPTFDGSRSCEVHVLEVLGARFQVLEQLTIEVMKKLRDVKKFDSVEELKTQIAKDREQAKQILSVEDRGLPPKT